MTYAYGLLAGLILVLTAVEPPDPYGFLLVLLLGTSAMTLVLVSGFRTARNIRAKPVATPLRHRLTASSLALLGLIVSLAAYRAGVEQPVPGLIAWVSVALALAFSFGLERRHRRRPPGDGLPRRG